MRFLKTALLSVFAASSALGEMIYHCTEPNTMALTFDDGPFQYTTQLLDTLAENNIKATFFVNAENYWKDLPTSAEKQAVLKRAHDEGHQIASHTWMHVIPEDRNELTTMMKKMDDFLEGVTGDRPKYFRAPKGNCGPDCIKFIEDLGYRIIQWDADTNDWRVIDKDVAATVKSSETFLEKVWAEERENYLVLMHDVQEHTVKQIVPWIVKHAPKDKYRFVTVAECLGDKNGMYAGKKVGFIAGNQTVEDANQAPVEAPVQVPVQAPVDNQSGIVTEEPKMGLNSSDAMSVKINLFSMAVAAFLILLFAY